MGVSTGQICYSSGNARAINGFKPSKAAPTITKTLLQEEWGDRPWIDARFSQDLRVTVYLVFCAVIFRHSGPMHILFSTVVINVNCEGHFIGWKKAPSWEMLLFQRWMWGIVNFQLPPVLIMSLMKDYNRHEDMRLYLCYPPFQTVHSGRQSIEI